MLPHEWAFGGFLAFMGLRTAWTGGRAAELAPAFFALLAVGVALTLWCNRQPSPLRWRLRLLWYPSAMGLTFYALPAAIAALGLHPVDGLLAGWDHALLGANAADFFNGLQSPLLSDAMMAAYVFFFWYLITGPAHYCIHDLPRLRSGFAGMFTIYALGFLGYSLLPAAGPHLALSFAQPLAEGPLTRLLVPPLAAGSNGIDAFPSIHVAISMYLLGFDWRHRPERARWLTLPCMALWVSTVYLRYHYLVDVFAGAALALFGLAVSAAWASSAQAMAVEARACLAQRARWPSSPTRSPSLAGPGPASPGTD